MRWPWVSRLALELVSQQRDRLEAENSVLAKRVAELTDAITRMQRFNLGMPETPRKPAPPPEPMPEDIQALVMAAGDPRIRAMQIQAAYHYRERYGSWQRVRDELAKRERLDEEPGT